ncbi:MAG TPA: archease [Thermoleophilia bacterium]|nr:archease [Thermoleophilia bacterium]
MAAPDGPAGFELTEHTADVGLRAWAPDPAGVFEQAALGLLSLICDPASVAGSESYTVVAEAPAGDLAAVLVAFLNELLYRIETDAIIFAGIAVGEPTDSAVSARATGEPLDAARHRPRLGVKAATYHRLFFGRLGSGWEARVVLDV